MPPLLRTPATLPPADPKYKVQKADAAFLVQSLEGRGYVVHTKRDVRIDAYNPTTKEHVCGFSWHKASRGLPGRWTFDITMADVFCLKDLKATLGELSRIDRLRPQAQAAWGEFVETKSEKRWGEYMSIMAALFLARPGPPAPGDPNNG